MSEQHSRRQFLRKTGSLAAGAAMPGGVVNIAETALDGSGNARLPAGINRIEKLATDFDDASEGLLKIFSMQQQAIQALSAGDEVPLTTLVESQCRTMFTLLKEIAEVMKPLQEQMRGNTPLGQLVQTDRNTSLKSLRGMLSLVDDKNGSYAQIKTVIDGTLSQADGMTNSELDEAVQSVMNQIRDDAPLLNDRMEALLSHLWDRDDKLCDAIYSRSGLKEEDVETLLETSLSMPGMEAGYVFLQNMEPAKAIAALRQGIETSVLEDLKCFLPRGSSLAQVEKLVDQMRKPLRERIEALQREFFPEVPVEATRPAESEVINEESHEQATSVRDKKSKNVQQGNHYRRKDYDSEGRDYFTGHKSLLTQYEKHTGIKAGDDMPYEKYVRLLRAVREDDRGVW